MTFRFWRMQRNLPAWAYVGAVGIQPGYVSGLARVNMRVVAAV